MTDDLTRITVAVIGIVIPVVFALSVRLATLRRSDRKEEKRTHSIDKALLTLHDAFLNDRKRSSQ